MIPSRGRRERCQLLAGGWAFCFALGALAADREMATADLLLQAARIELHPREREYAGRQILARGRAALTALLAGLRSERWIVRQTAAILLRELRDFEAEAALLQAAAGEDLITAALAAKSLAHLYAKLDEPALLARIAGHGQSAARGEEEGAAMAAAVLAAIALRQQCRLPELRQAILAKLDDARPDVRRAAASALAFCDGGEAAQALAQRCSVEVDANVQIQICRSLQRLRATADRRTLEALSASEHQLLALEAAAVMHVGGMEEGLEDILLWLKAGEAGVRQRAAEILGEMNEKRATAALRLACSDPVPEVRQAAVISLGKIEGATAAEVFNRLLQDPDGRVRAEAAVQLHRCRLPGSLRPLWEDLRSAETSHRIAAVHALARVAAPESVPALTAALSDDDLEVVCSAAEGLAAVGERRALPALFKALTDSRPAAAYAARLAMQRISGEDPGDAPDEQRRWAEHHLNGKTKAGD